MSLTLIQSLPVKGLSFSLIQSRLPGHRPKIGPDMPCGVDNEALT
jgi:hypothetical protein